MKKLYIILLLLIAQQTFSQYTSSGIGRWKLGLNVGATWQTADVSTDLFDLGYGATLEYALYQKRSSYFGFSLRGRFLQGKTTGYDFLSNSDPISNNAINGVLDTSINYSFSPLYLNNRTSLNEFSLEAMLKWNQLYQNHGILFYLYLGGGFTSYKVETDQLDANGDLYNYSLINNNNGLSTVSEIKNIQDNGFETELSHPNYNTLVFTPAVGAGLGFRITPGIDFAIEHKVSLPQTDLFDGQIYDSGDPSFIQDIYHYTSLGIIFSVVGHDEPETYIPPAEPSGPVTTTPINVTPVKPIIVVKQPTSNTFNTPNCKIEIIAEIKNVREQKDIDFYHNGNKVPSYKYFFSPNTFKSTIQLIDGKNNFKIIARNGNLSDTKEFSFQCKNVNTINICHKKLDGTFITLNIKELEWDSHKNHGDTKGGCSEKQITICHNVSGKPGVTETIQIDESKWAIHESHGDYLGNCQEKKMITICHNNEALTINEKDWNTHEAHGDVKGPCPQTNRITICHIPPTGDRRQTLSILENEWIVHEAHGDSKGSCPSSETTTTICHKNADDSKTTMTIPEFRWNEHFSHGDSKGACPQSSFIICHTDPSSGKKKNISIYESGWEAHKSHGDTRGACPIIDKQITICHNVPGQPGKTETITIPESKWQIHKSHGDKLGSCKAPISYIKICHNFKGKESNLTIKESEWATHKAHGDTKGTCPIIDKQITICHNVPGQPGKTETITIPESKWQIHKSHGDKLGACKAPDTYIKICHNSNGGKSNITIKESDWATHAAHGDTKGTCPIIDKKITICHNVPGQSGKTETITILESKWQIHKSHGDTKGKCDTPNESRMTICHKPKDGGASQTIEIWSSSWKTHEAHGDTQGECTSDNSGMGNTNNGNPKITICHKNAKDNTTQTIQISPNAWPAHQAHGDAKGACSNKKKGKK